MGSTTADRAGARAPRTRRILAVVSAVAVVTLTGACGGDEVDGTPLAGRDLGPGPGPFDAGLIDAGLIDAGLIDTDGLDPCGALTVDDLTSLGLPTVAAEEDVGNDGRHCGWENGGTRVLVAIGDGDFAEVEEGLGLGVAVPESFDGRDAARIDSPEACGLLFHATDDSTLGVITSNPDGECSVVDEAASLVLANVG